jgi:hypothetical protein
MRLRVQGQRPSVDFAKPLINKPVRVMASKVCGAFVASLGAVVLVLSVNAAEAGSPGGARGAFAAARAGVHPHFPGAFRRHHRIGSFGAFWPGDFDYGPEGEPLAGVPQPPASNDVRYTTTYDIPWDWAHRFPPMVTPSDRPYVPSCTAETVTVPGRDGGDHTVNVTRCY